MFLSPSMINRILKAGYFKKYDVSSITKVYVGGAIFTAKSQIELQECLPHADVIQMYGKAKKIRAIICHVSYNLQTKFVNRIIYKFLGMTELCGVITAQKPNHKAGTVGTVTSNAQLKIIDLKTGNALGPNQAGELLTKSIMMTKGYYNNPQATKDTIDADGKGTKKKKIEIIY